MHVLILKLVTQDITQKMKQKDLLELTNPSFQSHGIFGSSTLSNMV